MKLETHVHTRYSHDSIHSLSFLYLMSRLRGVECIAITDHNTIKGGVEFKKFCEKRGNRISVIIGEEIMTSRGEVIGLFLNSEIPAGLSPDETINEIVRQGGIVYIPHPFDLKRHKTVMCFEDIRINRDHIDCIECHNGRNVSTDYSINQNEIAEKLGLQKVVGSDAHTFIEIGRNYMNVAATCISTPEEFRVAIATADRHKSNCINLAHQITKFERIIKYIIRGDINGLFGIIIKKVRR